MDPQFDELNATTKMEMYPSVLEDVFFKGSPFLAYMKQEGLHPFHGGSSMRNAFVFRPGIGGPYSPGDNFPTTRVPSISAMQFRPKYYFAGVPEFKEILQVENIGENAVYSIVDVDLRNAMQTINAIIAIALYREGQSAGRIKHLNGLSEVIGNGTDPSWEGTIATSYGGHLRGGVVGDKLSATPLWVGNSDGSAGTIQYKHLTESYWDSAQGEDEPNIGLCNKAVFAFILQRIQPQQRFAQEQDPYWGATSFKMFRARIMVDEYAPSAIYGESHAVLGSNLTGSFAGPTTPTTKSRIPSGAVTLTIGETFFWLNTRTLMFRMATDEEFGFGWSGFKPGFDNTRVFGEIKAAINLQCISPKLNKMLFGIGS